MKILICFLFFLLCSCQYLNKELSEKQIVKARLKEINWHKVDKMPSIDNCNTLNPEIEQEKCFFEYIEQTIKEKLQQNKNLLKTDSLTVKVMISNQGKAEFIVANNSKIDSIVKLSLIDFPKITPAIKQGMYVKTQFYLKLTL